MERSLGAPSKGETNVVDAKCRETSQQFNALKATWMTFGDIDGHTSPDFVPSVSELSQGMLLAAFQNQLTYTVQRDMLPGGEKAYRFVL